MNPNIKTGMFRVWLLISVLWIAGMGWHQYQQSQQVAHKELTIQFSDDAAFKLQAHTPENQDAVMQRWLIVLLPPLLLLLMFPVGTWLARGFKPNGQ